MVTTIVPEVVGGRKLFVSGTRPALSMHLFWFGVDYITVADDVRGGRFQGGSGFFFWGWHVEGGVIVCGAGEHFLDGERSSFPQSDVDPVEFGSKYVLHASFLVGWQAEGWARVGSAD